MSGGPTARPEGAEGGAETVPDLVAACFGRLAALDASLATAESLTGGLLGAELTGVSGASSVYRGGVVAYTVELKAGLLGVPRDVLDRHGPVHEETVAAMARGAAERCGATYALATTGVAGPEPHGDQPVGTVWLGCAGPEPGRVALARQRFEGGRDDVRRASVEAALRLLLRVLTEPGHG